MQKGGQQSVDQLANTTGQGSNAKLTETLGSKQWPLTGLLLHTSSLPWATQSSDE
ncbi:hypothetical protein XAP412_120011 [Xanthomonas phaseoli pv. phaseoli]|uniref:Uncharacterized protein n=1 Tax=Xanthomonas campestris pv. phaseoli TaxID=317013 RepID=A0AB38DU30_XANCH|nr:hypothetical protein XAP7430_100057 [Xanthomonas phaseoli pv. phaseoli]SON77170.1 hypothetical protein XAP412_120011 [Xanthomonas phaseoli pv. phaseoli]SON77972.1 hypothetical protein XAP6984_160011 [Xanthomonas phaseoli pv. phaseoli]